jgi:hypothetical protein
LRRAVPSFKVEVRRRPRLATTSNSDAQSSETRSPPAGFDRESHRVAAAAFEAKKVDASASDVGASPPRGRILPSLAPDEPRYFLLKEIPVPAAESDVPSRAPKRREQAPKSPRNSGFLSAKSAPLAESLSSKSRQSSSMQSGGLTPGAKAKRRDKMAISRDDARAKPLPNDQRSAIGTDSPSTLPPRVDDRSPDCRKRTIMARYVFGDELKPGERWKRRLLTTR